MSKTKITDKDLENITTPYGLLSAEMRSALRACGEVEAFRADGWNSVGNPAFLVSVSYRKKSAPVEPVIEEVTLYGDAEALEFQTFTPDLESWQTHVLTYTLRDGKVVKGSADIVPL